MMNLFVYLYTAAALPFSPNDVGVPDTAGVTLDNGLTTILTLVYTALGAVSVVYIVIGGIKYITSGGDSAGVKSAKETITYAIIGLAVALLAFGAVNFITTQAGNAAK